MSCSCHQNSGLQGSPKEPLSLSLNRCTAKQRLVSGYSSWLIAHHRCIHTEACGVNNHIVKFWSGKTPILRSLQDICNSHSCGNHSTSSHSCLDHDASRRTPGSASVIQLMPSSMMIALQAAGVKSVRISLDQGLQIFELAQGLFTNICTKRGGAVNLFLATYFHSVEACHVA